MSISTISDVHVRGPSDESYELLLKFLKHPSVLSSNEVFLLGDIFDLMCGPHEAYISMYSDYFEGIGSLLREQVKVHYFEGNHDLHLSRLYKKYLSQKNIDETNFLIHKKPFQAEFEGKKFYFSHGDELQLGQYGYRLYKYIVHSAPFELLANNVVPYDLLNSIGTKASEGSRKRNMNAHFDKVVLRDSFRLGAMLVASKGYDFVIAGHSHIADQYHNTDFTRPFTYLNNGALFESKAFIHIEKNKVEFVDL